MKHITSTLVAILGLSLCAQQAGAIPIDTPTYQDIDEFLVVLSDPLLGGLSSMGGTFDITARGSDGSPSVTIPGSGDPNAYLNAGTTYDDILGFVPGDLERIVEANAFFYLRDDNGSAVYSVDLTDFVTETVEGGGNFSRFILGGSLGSFALDMLNNSGTLDYAVEWEAGEFTFDYAQLQVVLTVPGGEPPDAVPDAGSTGTLFGGALLVLGTFARRLRVA